MKREPADIPIEPAPTQAISRVASQYGERDEQCLLDIVDFSLLSEDLVGRGKSAYDADPQLQLAGEAIMHRVGEAVSRLSDALIKDHPEIRFRAMKRARNKVAHHYAIVDPEIIWSSLEGALPVDVAAIHALLEEPAIGTIR